MCGKPQVELIIVFILLQIDNWYISKETQRYTDGTILPHIFRQTYIAV